MFDHKEFYGLLKLQPQVRNLKHEYLNTLDGENNQTMLLLYMAQFCQNLTCLQWKLENSSIISFKEGFSALETLDLEFSEFNSWSIITTAQAKTKRHFVSSTMKHVTALPKLRILKIQRIDSEIDDEVTWETLQNLVSLELKKVSETFVKKILRCCPEGLTDLLVCSLRDSTDIQFMMDKLPNLKTVGFHHCTFAEDKLSLFLAKFARQVQYLYFNSANFKSVHLDQLTNLASPSLQAFDHADIDINALEPNIERFVQQYGGQLKRLFFYYHEQPFDEITSMLDDEFLELVLDNCPLLVEQGEWDLSGWNLLTYDGFYNFLDRTGPKLKMFIPPRTHRQGYILCISITRPPPRTQSLR